MYLKTNKYIYIYIYIYMITYCSDLLRMRNVKSCKGNQNTHCMFYNIFFENHAAYEIM